MLAKKLRSDRMDIFYLKYVQHMEGLWIYLLVEIPQTISNTRLVYNLYWSGLNECINQDAPKGDMSFLQALHILIDFILVAYPALGPEYLSKVDLANSYVII